MPTTIHIDTVPITMLPGDKITICRTENGYEYAYTTPAPDPAHGGETREAGVHGRAQDGALGERLKLAQASTMRFVKRCEEIVAGKD